MRKVAGARARPRLLLVLPSLYLQRNCRLPGSNLLLGLPVVLDTNSEEVREGHKVRTSSSASCLWRAQRDCSSRRSAAAGGTGTAPQAAASA